MKDGKYDRSKDRGIFHVVNDSKVMERQLEDKRMEIAALKAEK